MTESIADSPVISRELKEELLTDFHEEGMVIVHCTYDAEIDGGIRIWRTTFLVDQVSGHRSPLHHAERITMAPAWLPVPAGMRHTFTLIFGPLPGSCTVFDLVEEIPEPGGFFVPEIRRNQEDVYRVKVV